MTTDRHISPLAIQNRSKLKFSLVYEGKEYLSEDCVQNHDNSVFQVPVNQTICNGKIVDLKYMNVFTVGQDTKEFDYSINQLTRSSHPFDLRLKIIGWKMATKAGSPKPANINGPFSKVEIYFNSK